MIRRPPRSTRTDTLLPYTTLFRSIAEAARERNADLLVSHLSPGSAEDLEYAMATSRATGVIFIGQSSLHHAFNALAKRDNRFRSEEHTSELQSLMRISYAVFCLKKKITVINYNPYKTHTQLN